jgi:hypothetical protein
MRNFIRIAVLGVALGGAAACAAHSPNIASIRNNPGRYYDRTVSVDGVVRDSWSVPLLPYRVYKIEDRTGEVTVLSESGRVPAAGAHVQVTGRIEDMASFGGRSIGLHIRQSRLHVYRD